MVDPGHGLDDHPVPYEVDIRYIGDETPAPATPALAAPWLSAGHRITCDDPLTIEGSLLCGSCHAHRFVRDGHWVPA